MLRHLVLVAAYLLYCQHRSINKAGCKLQKQMPFPLPLVAYDQLGFKSFATILHSKLLTTTLLVSAADAEWCPAMNFPLKNESVKDSQCWYFRPTR